MTTFRLTDLHALSAALMQAAGAPSEDAHIIADHCIRSLRSGELHHGMELGTQYVPLIEEGLLVPGAALEIVKETPTTLMVDGNFNFGHVVSHRVMEMIVAKARDTMVAAASIRNQTHVGCLIDYTAMAAESGMIALMMTDGARGPKLMAPYGGRERRLGINPWSMTLPNDTGGVVGFDMTSGTVSLLKVRRAHDEGRAIPEGWVIDKEGHPTRDPQDFYDGGTVLPLGGAQGHKGYALAFMIEALADVLSGMDYGEDLSREWPVIDGCFMAVFNVEAFRPLAEFREHLSGMLDWVTSSAPADGHERVLYPGERSHLHGSAVDAGGGLVEIPPDVWASIVEVAGRLGVAVPDDHAAPARP